MRKCKCKSDMEYVGSMGNDGRYWCPECGRYSQSYACVPMEWKTPRNLPKAEASDAVLCAVPIVAGDSYGIQFLCSACDFPKDETLTMDMKHCWNCGVKLDLEKCDY